jgi:poly(A) polymerase
MQVLKEHPQWPLVEKIVTQLIESGYQAVLAGGCVRDALLGVLPQDIDVATNATPDKIEELFAKTLAIGKKFGIIIVVEDGIEPVEVASFREESTYSDGRHPDKIVYSDIEKDAQRRDFTVNGLFFDPQNNKILDFVEGQKDLKSRVLRAIGDPEKRFDEDKLRLLRAIRFAAQLDFAIEDKTYLSLARAPERISVVSTERIRDEFDKILLSQDPLKGLYLLDVLGYLDCIALKRPSESQWIQTKTKMARILKSGDLKKLSKKQRISMFLTLLFRDDLDDLENMRHSKEMMSAVKESRNFAKEALRWDELDLAGKRKLVSVESFLQNLIMLRADQSLESEALEQINQLKQKYPDLPECFLSGKDLKDLGCKPGPEMGDFLDKIFTKQLNLEFKTKAEATKWVKLELDRA